MNKQILAGLAVLLLVGGMASGEAASPAGADSAALQYRYEDFRIGYIGEGVGDLVAMPKAMETDGYENALVLTLVRLPTTMESELATTGFGDSGRIPGPFRYEVVAVKPGGGVSIMIDAGTGISGESRQLDGISSGEKGIFLFSRSPGGTGGDYPRIMYFSGKRRSLSFDSANYTGSRPGEKIRKYSREISRRIGARNAASLPVKISAEPPLKIAIRGLAGWGADLREIPAGPDPKGEEYIKGICAGVDREHNLYLLMTRRGGDEEFSTRKSQDLVIMAPDGTRLATIELPPWRDDLWSSGGENLLIGRDGGILQLWSRGNTAYLRRWSR
jgi:hypothetical protein